MVVLYYFLFQRFNSTVLCRLVKGYAGQQQQQSLAERKNRVRIMEWKKKVSSNKRARNDRFFADAFFSPYMYRSSVVVVAIFSICFFFSFLIPNPDSESPPSQTHGDDGTENVCASRGEE